MIELALSRAIPEYMTNSRCHVSLPSISITAGDLLNDAWDG
jgi:hypothetical protein